MLPAAGAGAGAPKLKPPAPMLPAAGAGAGAPKLKPPAPTLPPPKLKPPGPTLPGALGALVAPAAALGAAGFGVSQAAHAAAPLSLRTSQTSHFQEPSFAAVNDAQVAAALDSAAGSSSSSVAVQSSSESPSPRTQSTYHSTKASRATVPPGASLRSVRRCSSSQYVVPRASMSAWNLLEGTDVAPSATVSKASRALWLSSSRSSASSSSESSSAFAQSAT